MRLKLTARKYTENNGMVATELFGVKATTEIEVTTLDEAAKEAQAFAFLHAPANVWVTPLDKRKPKGFDRWNADSASRYLA
jgi:hypothetical protein